MLLAVDLLERVLSKMSMGKGRRTSLVELMPLLENAEANGRIPRAAMKKSTCLETILRDNSTKGEDKLYST